MVALYAQNNIQKNPNALRQNMQWKQRYRWNDIIQWLEETFGIFRRLEAE